MKSQKMWIRLLLLGSILFLACESNKKVKTLQVNLPQDQYEVKRNEMVQQQILARDIQDKNVISAMRSVPRHEFVSTNYMDLAYQDSPLPIGYEQTISQPYIVAYMTEMLKLTENDTVLEIGTGSGYQAAVLAEVVSQVFSIEIIDELGEKAAKTLEKLGFNNIIVKLGDGYKGWPENAPFDAIILTAAPPKIPNPILEQLKDGGRLIAPVGNEFQELILITKKGKKLKRKRLIPVRFVPMTGEAQKKD
jgi:protein-L-isoaspartate(D-aspartate) O-methyltransferase